MQAYKGLAKKESVRNLSNSSRFCQPVTEKKANPAKRNFELINAPYQIYAKIPTHPVKAALFKH